MSQNRSWLDLVVTLAILATCAVLVVANWSKLWPPGQVPRMTPLSVEGATLKGNSTASVVIIEWSDYQCPYCALAEREVMAAIDGRYIRPGRVQLAFRHHPLTTIHPQAMKASEAALCAGEQRRFWEMHAALFQEASRLADSDLLSRARAIGLEVSRFESCLTSGATSTRVQEDVKQARLLGLTATPAFLIGRRQNDGRINVTTVLRGVRPLDEFVEAIEGAAADQADGWYRLTLITAGILAVVSPWVWRKRVAVRRSRETARRSRASRDNGVAQLGGES